MTSTRYTPSPEDAPQEDSPEERPQDSYFEDDEEILRGDDTVLEETDDFAAVQQLDHLITWEVEGAFDERGNVRKRMDLRREPPVLKVKDASGAEIEFVLTKELARMLFQVLEAVYKGYFGINTKRESIYGRGFAGLLEEAKRRRVMLIIFFVLLLLAFIAPKLGGL